MAPDLAPSSRLTVTQWLVLVMAAIGFMFDTYELLMAPLVLGPAMSELLKAPPGSPPVLAWSTAVFWSSTLLGGIFGLLGGYLTDWFGRRRVLTWSILLYAFSACGAAFSTSPWMLLVLRCTTFMGVCVEFVAAVAWLAELFPQPKQREQVLGYTQVFASLGGILVATANSLAVQYAEHWPAIAGSNSSWRYTLLSGVIPAIPLILIRPFLPESPTWQAKKQAGTLRRPSFAELFSPQLRRTTLASTLVCTCGFAAAYGAIQLTPSQVVTKVPDVAPLYDQLDAARKEFGGLSKQLQALPPDSPERPALAAQLEEAKKSRGALQRKWEQYPNRVQFYQEIGGLTGRLLLAIAAIYLVSRRGVLACFQLPGLILLPLVYGVAATREVALLQWGMFAVGLVTVAQFSFWGNYLPRVYPLHLRGTGEGFVVNFGGRVLASFAFLLTPLVSQLFQGPFAVAYAAACVGFAVYFIGFVGRMYLPEPAEEALPE